MNPTAANVYERKSPRWTGVVMTVTSFGVFVAGPAIAEIRHNPFAGGNSDTAVINSDSLPTISAESKTAKRSSSVQDSRPQRLPLVLPPSTPQESSETKPRSQETLTEKTTVFGQPKQTDAAPGIIPTSIESVPTTQVKFELATEPKKQGLGGAKESQIQRSAMVLPADDDDTTKVTPQLAVKVEHQTIDANKTIQTRLRSTTAQSTYRLARQQLDQAIIEYRVGALASAEASVWMSLRGVAEAADIQYADNAGQASFVEDLSFASHAIRESRDFFGLTASAITRIAISHQTKLLAAGSGDQLNASDASDLYLDEARVRLARIAALNSDAAEAMDILAAIYLGRGETHLMPGPISLCLRRAALQGQPGNANLAARLGMQLADTGLHDEAYIVLKHAYALEPNDETSVALQSVARLCGQPATAVAANQNRSRTQTTPVRPDVIQLSPNEFAAISQPVIQVAATTQVKSQASTNDHHRVFSDESSNTDETDSSEEQSETPSRFQRFTGSLTRFWK